MNRLIPIIINVANTRIKYEVTQTIDLRAGEKCYERTWSSKWSSNTSVGQPTPMFIWLFYPIELFSLRRRRDVCANDRSANDRGLENAT